ncbi:flocculation protein FLO11 isoform X2 [Triticum aestivum]|uniref:flocculation protein FLO11 isoform X2 n=1 Tax=Triticum aestivum TaxID=4565 RepID=UPI001D01923F|nr:flocculation protein FLO11-like isoform X2 [Triticum aestivum]
MSCPARPSASPSPPQSRRSRRTVDDGALSLAVFTSPVPTPLMNTATTFATPSTRCTSPSSSPSTRTTAAAAPSVTDVVPPSSSSPATSTTRHISDED